MKWALPLLLALQLPVDAPPPQAGNEDTSAHERRRAAIVRMNEGVDMFAEGDLAGAQQAFEQAIRIDPSDARPHVNLARLAMARGPINAADAELERALELVNAEQGRVSPVGDTNAEFNALSQLRAEIQYDLGRVHLARARDLENFSKRERDSEALAAAQAFEQATTMSISGYPPTDRRDYEAHYQRGVAYDLLDDADEAERSYAACLDIRSSYTPCWTARARLYLDFGEPRAAEITLETATTIYENDAELWTATAELYRKLGRPKEAVDAGNKAKAINPDLADARFELGMAYADLRMREEARDELNAYMHLQIAQPRARVRAATDMLFWLIEGDGAG